MKPYAARRARLMETLGKNTAALFVSTPTAVRNNDVEHDYRQDSDVYYLTGFDEPDSVLLLCPRGKVKRPVESVADDIDLGKPDEPPTADLMERACDFVLFVRPRDPEREVWDGYRAGLEGAQTTFGADAAFKITELPQKLPELLAGHDAVAYRWSTSFDATLFAAINQTRRTAGRRGLAAPTRILDPLESLYEHRLCKDETEVALMRKAAAITAEGHIKAMAKAAPGIYEHELEAILLETFRRHGSERAAYGSIVGSGPNATILHYRRNDRQILADELVLIDAGCEYGYYASDVTRTFPASGTFTEPQREIYQLVLDAQLASIALVKPGVTQGEIHDKAVEVLTEGLIRLGILQGTLDENIKGERYKPFYMHKTGHWLGMDVHDVGAYFVKKEGSDTLVHRPLAPGMVITIEPGLYFGETAKVDARYKGIGVRIEDDILVTQDGYENLTAAIPKSVEDVERACRAG